MSGGLIGCALTPHTPRMANEDGAPDFIRPLIAGSRALGDWIRHLEPDGVVLHTTHWISTFNWYTSSHAIHEGHCIADEAPELVPGLPYKYTGDPTLAQEIIDVALAKNIPFKSNDNPHYRWDYGTYVPMKYIDPEATLPIVTLPTVILAKLDECIRVGQALDAAAKKQNKRIVFIGSSALSHELVRGPEQWPTESRQQLDKRFIQMIANGAIDPAIQWLPEYAKASVAEMSGRVVATFLGASSCLQSSTLKTYQFGEYAQSSGSGNLSIALANQ